jgi:UDP-N-acetylglucosamine 4,6-dehydratase
VITPAIKFFGMSVDYEENKLSEKGKFVTEQFEYHSGTNPHFLTVDELIELDKQTL